MGSPGIKDVAALAGVSVGTVSNALNHPDAVAPDTLDRVLRAMEKISYVRNEVARQLRLGKSSALAFISTTFEVPYLADIAFSAAAAAEEAGYSLITGDGGESEDRQSRYLALFEQLRVQGILFAATGDPGPQLRAIRNRGIPTVIVGRASTDRRVSSVSIDDAMGGSIAAAHLISRGRKRLAFVAPVRADARARVRLTGAIAEVRRHAGASIEAIDVGNSTVEAGRTGGRLILRQAKGQRPDGLIAGNDLIGSGLVESFVRVADLQLPRDVSVICYEDTPRANKSEVTALRPPTQRMGQRAVEILLAEAAADGTKPRQVRYYPELVVRATTD